MDDKIVVTRCDQDEWMSVSLDHPRDETTCTICDAVPVVAGGFVKCDKPLGRLLLWHLRSLPGKRAPRPS